MMTTRAFLACILGGIAMFIWSFVAHDLLPLGEIGMRQFNNEDHVLDTLKTNLGDLAGIYHSQDTWPVRTRPARRKPRR